MGTTLTEFILMLGLGFGLYRLLTPLRERLENWLIEIIQPPKSSRGRVIDVEPENKNKKGS